MLENFFMPDGKLAVVRGEIGKTVVEYVESGFPFDPGAPVYFAPAPRKTEGNEKSDVLGTRVLWVDCDHMERPRCTFPPSVLVFSGHGWHCYWFLREPLYDIELIESLNKILIRDVPTADKACWNVNRFMRMPGSTNLKDPQEPVRCEIRTYTQVSYTRDDIILLDRIDDKTKHKIATGDSRGYHSRSERDWAIVTALTAAGADDSLIEDLFKHQPCGDKFRDETTSAQYLSTTIAKARERAGPVRTFGNDLEEREDGYYHQSGRSVKRVSTFTVDPKLLLDGSILGSEDAIVGCVTASGHRWEDITFTRSAFTSVFRLDRETPVAAWQWLGRDDEVRLLLPHLLGMLQEKGLPRVTAAPAQGLYMVSGVPYFVGHASVLGPGRYWTGYDGPIAWLPTQREHTELDLDPDCRDETLEYIAGSVTRLHTPEVIWTLLGWYAATALKPWLESMGYRFPILNVSGTRGSGKTTLIQRVMMPLFGQTKPKSYDAGTTKFVMLSCLGSTNAVPIAFSEFRYESVEKFLRYILLAYDSGHDPRGRADQTTQDYVLSAPFSVDGEDIIADPAARERIVCAQLHPDDVMEGSETYETYKRWADNPPARFGGFFIRRCLEILAAGGMEGLLSKARDDIFKSFPGRLPDRVRNNHIVVRFGSILFADALDIKHPSPGLLSASIDAVYNRAGGRSRTLADDFLEDLVNALPTQYFKYDYDASAGLLYFQLASTYSWWVAQRRRQGKTALERDAISIQLKEAPYVTGPVMKTNTFMYVVNLKEAQDAGLDIPKHIDFGSITIHL